MSTRFTQSPLRGSGMQRPVHTQSSYMPRTATYSSPPVGTTRGYRAPQSGRKNVPRSQYKGRSTKQRNVDTQPSFWDRLFCQGTEGFKMKNIQNALGWSSEPTAGKSRRYHRTLSFETVDDWEKGPHPSTGYPRGRPDDSPAEDLNIQIRDLFPCLGDLWDFLGCPKKPARRAMKVPRAAKGPQLETVCLECGHLLEAHPLPHGVQHELRNQADVPWGGFGNTASTGMPFADETLAKTGPFVGYRDWQIDDTAVVPFDATKHVADKIPLPSISPGPQRTFMNAPGATRVESQWMDNDFLPLDPTGRVELPDFKTGSDNGV